MRPRSPDPPIGGVQATDEVIVHFGALEIFRPGSWNRALLSARPSAPIRLVRYLVSAMVMPPFQATLGSGRVNASSSKPWLRTPAFLWPVQAPVRGSLSTSAPLRSSLQLLIVSTKKLSPLKVFSWK